MSTRLTLTDAHGQTQDFPIDEPEVYIGRDPSCGIYIESDEISRQHAVIRSVDGRHLFVDLDSTNGSTVNRVPATSPIYLNDGDAIDLAGALHFEYRADSIGDADALGLNPSNMSIWAALLCTLVLVLVVGAAYFLWSDGERDHALDEAVELAEQGIAAARKGDQLAARDFLRSAAGDLYTAGYLDHVARGDLQREAMLLLQNELDVSFDLWSFYDNVLRQPHVPRGASTPKLSCRLDEVEAREFERCLKHWIEHILLEIHQDIDSIPEDFHYEVGARLRIENGFISRSIARGEPIVPILRRELEEGRMPPLLHYLALIESGYQNSATSTAAAAGVWQFMPATGRQYGLRIDKSIDDRRNTEKATRAATRYLRDLAFEFGGDALLLALAGYNRGENGVRRSLKKLDDPFSDRSYWRLVERDLLPDETQTYVPRFIAAAVAGEGGLPSVQVLEEAGY